MMKLISKGKAKKELCYDEARALFIAGKELTEIAETLHVSHETLKEWQSSGLWERKKELVADHPKLIGETLKGLVKQKTKALLDNSENINLSDIEELTKFIILIERLEENSWDERAAVVEIMSLFSEFFRRQVREQEKLRFLTKLMEKFFEEMEGS
jgi:hypothetical protein